MKKTMSGRSLVVVLVSRNNSAPPRPVVRNSFGFIAKNVQNVIKLRNNYSAIFCVLKQGRVGQLRKCSLNFHS